LGSVFNSERKQSPHRCCQAVLPGFTNHSGTVHVIPLKWAQRGHVTVEVAGHLRLFHIRFGGACKGCSQAKCLTSQTVPNRDWRVSWL
jgi:Fe-S cluster biogenesis protein NfuA